ncbi:hypothetical protein V6N13_025504 [Hibiscus sabdariffa]
MSGKGIGQTLKVCKSTTKQWRQAKKNSDYASTSTLEQQQMKLEAELQSDGGNRSKVKELSIIREKLWAQYRIEEQEWIQKSRDRNSRFFHMVASSKRRMNTIHTPRVADKVLDKPVAIKDAINEHFKKVYNAHPTIPVKSFEFLLNTISKEKASTLEWEFTLDEIKAALFSMDGTRALVFRNVSIEVDHMFQLSLLRVCRWGSAKWAPLFPLLSTILARSEALESVSLVRPLLSPSLWFPPEAEALKFDIDGAVSGSFGPAEESSSAFWPRVEGLDWQVFLIARVQNTLAADNLAKKGISISRDIAEFLLD